MDNSMKIYASINAITADLVKSGGVSKDHKNQQQGYNFRGIDDVLNVLAPLLAKHGVCIFPKVLNVTRSEGSTKSGGTLFNTQVECEFHFVSALDNSCHIAVTVGEAMDSGDKSTNKAMSAAYKYACILTFCIPTEVEDADATTPEPVKRVPVNVGVTNSGVQVPSKTNGNGKGLAEIQTAKWQDVIAKAMQHGYVPDKSMQSLSRLRAVAYSAGLLSVNDLNVGDAWLAIEKHYQEKQTA